MIEIINAENNSSKDSMPIVPIPEPTFVTQSNCEGKQIIRKQSILSFFSSFCNCFRLSGMNYMKPEDYNLLTPATPEFLNRNTLVLDLDETLIHSNFSKTDCDISLNIKVEKKNYWIYALKRPGVDRFLARCGELFEVVVFTASLSSYADPLLNALDKSKTISQRLYRESCSYINGSYVKDLSKLGRDLRHVVIIDVTLI